MLEILHVVLEKNIDDSVAYEFKMNLKQILLALAKKIQDSFGKTTEESISTVLQIYTSVIGFWQLTNNSTTVKNILKNEELMIFKLEFKQELKKIMNKLL